MRIQRKVCEMGCRDGNNKLFVFGVCEEDDDAGDYSEAGAEGYEGVGGELCEVIGEDCWEGSEVEEGGEEDRRAS